MIDFMLPSLGADMDEAKLVKWLVGPGDTVNKGQIIAEVETDKAVLEVECWDQGVITEILVVPGPARLRVGTVLARIRPEGVVEPPKPGAPAPERAAPSRPLTKPIKVAPPVRHLAHELGVDLDRVVGTGTGGSITREDVRRAGRPHRQKPERIKASPRARRLADELGVDLSTVTATGVDGLITTSDVRAALPASEVAPPAAAPTPSAPPALDEGRIEAMRRAIARSMSHSKREIPHYYLATHIDLTRALRWLDERNAARPITGRVLPAALLLKATALALHETPELNGYWLDDHFQPSQAVHLGVAISLREGGLVAPAIHDADHLDLDETMASLRDLVNRARSWRLRSSEMSDPTATVTNLGDRGVETAYPIIIPPQVAMVGFGKIVETPVAVQGLLGIAPRVNATLSGDHRATDGHRGGLLLMTLDRLLQEPERL